ncbi:hypothetical protein BDN67DRAFT_913920, partial [Paxillus ammoniavirescens]
FTLLASYIVNTLEVQMLSIFCNKTSPITMAVYTQFGDSFWHPPHTGDQILHQLLCLTVTWSDTRVLDQGNN